MSSASVTIGVIGLGVGAGGATVEVGVVVTAGCVAMSQWVSSWSTYRAPSAVLTSVSFSPSFSVAADWPLS